MPQIDYFGIVKKAAQDTWKHKALWLFGILAVLGGGGGGGGSNYSSFGNSSQGNVQRQAERLGQDINWEAMIGILIAVAVVLLFIGLVLFVLRLIAEGAMIGMARDIARGSTPTVSDGFSVGWRYAFKVFVIDFLLGLPLVVGILAIAGIAIVVIVGMAGAAGAGSAGGQSSGIAAVMGSLCGVFIAIGVGVLILVPTAIVTSVLMELARRQAVLFDTAIIDSIREAWGIFRGRFKDIALWWLTMLVVGIAVGVVMGVLALILIVPALALVLVSPLAGVALLIPGAMLAVFLSGVVQAFRSVAWTDFFMMVRPLPGPAAEGAPVPAPAIAPITGV